jgi:hypothetical protein
VLHGHLPGRWIEIGGPVPWPPRSPDLTLLYFFLWDYVKDIVWNDQVCKLQDLYTESAATATVTVALLTGMWTELNYYLDICRTVNGVHIGLDWFIIISSTCHVANFSGNFIWKSYNIHSTFQWLQNCGSKRNTIWYITSTHLLQSCRKHNTVKSWVEVLHRLVLRL